MTLRKEDDDITQDINILRTNSLSQETIRYPCFKPEIVLQAHKDPCTSNTIKIFQKFESVNFIQKLLKQESQKMITIPLPPETMQQLIIKPLRRFEGLCCRKKNKTWKIANTLKNCLNSLL